MVLMFYGAEPSTDISAWNTAAVTTMISACSATPQPSTGDISAWNTAAVTAMAYMFLWRRMPSTATHLCLEHGGGDDDVEHVLWLL